MKNAFLLLLLFGCCQLIIVSAQAQDGLSTLEQIAQMRKPVSVLLPVEQQQAPELKWQDDATVTKSPPLLESLQPSQQGSSTRLPIETPLGSDSKSDSSSTQDPYDLDSLEPAGPSSPEMEFPYPRSDELVDPQNTLKPALPLPSAEPGLSVAPISPAAPVSRPTLGVVGRPINGWGFRIDSVVPGSAAARMRLEPGDVVLSVNGQRSCSAASIAQQLLYSSKHRGGQGILVIDNVRSRNSRTVRTCRGTYSVPNRLRFQKIGFRL